MQNFLCKIFCAKCRCHIHFIFVEICAKNQKSLQKTRNEHKKRNFWGQKKIFGAKKLFFGKKIEKTNTNIEITNKIAENQHKH